MLGDFAVGKSSLMRRFLFGTFDERYRKTSFIKASHRIIAITTGSAVLELSLVIWDLPSDDDGNEVPGAYLRGVSGAVLACDLTRPQTLASLPANADAVRRANLDAKLVIAANKFDLADARQLNNEQLRSMAGELRAPFYLTSAKTGDAVETLFRHLGRLLIS